MAPVDPAAPRPRPPGKAGPAADGGGPANAEIALGLPEAGAGSLAPLGRRFAAVIIDWIAAQFVAAALLRASLTTGGSSSWVVLAVFAALSVAALIAVGATLGHWLLGLRLRPVRGGWWPGQVAVRTAALCLFLPAVLTGADGRGFHDRWAGTVLVRR